MMIMDLSCNDRAVTEGVYCGKMMYADNSNTPATQSCTLHKQLWNTNNYDHNDNMQQCVILINPRTPVQVPVER